MAAGHPWAIIGTKGAPISMKPTVLGLTVPTRLLAIADRVRALRNFKSAPNCPRDISPRCPASTGQLAPHLECNGTARSNASLESLQAGLRPPVRAVPCHNSDVWKFVVWLLSGFIEFIEKLRCLNTKLVISTLRIRRVISGKLWSEI